MKIFPQALLPLLIGIGGGSITTASASITASSAASDTDTDTVDTDVTEAIGDSPPQQPPAQTQRMLRKKHKPKSEKDPPPPTEWWLSNLPNPGQCNATEATPVNCADLSGPPTDPNYREWGYYLTCFDNPNGTAKFLKGIRFWTADPYGVGPGIGTRVTVYYGSKTFGPYQTGLAFPYDAGLRFDVPATSAPQTTFVSGLNTFTFSGPDGNGERLFDGFEGGFCIGLTPPFRARSSPHCDYPVIRYGATYCPDPGLKVLATGSGDGSYINCNDGGENNPARGFGANNDFSLPGYCMEVLVSDQVSDDQVKVTWDIQYGSAYNNETNKEEGLYLDKYEPRDDPSDQKPVAIIVHGGSCMRGSRKEQKYIELATYFARNGFVALSISYRKQSTLASCRTPGSIQAAGSDVKASIRFSKQNSVAWGIDPSKIWLYGCSAGARAAAWATYVPGNGLDEELGDLSAPLVKTSKNSPEYDADVTYLTMLSGELYVPHINCDLYACYDHTDYCIEPNAPTPGCGPYKTSTCDYNCVYESWGYPELCNPERSHGCLNALSSDSTPLTIIHNRVDNLVGTFTPLQVQLRLQALAESKGVPVEFILNGLDPGHCSPPYPLDKLLRIARKGLGIDEDEIQCPDDEIFD